jgi:hypothetical protein
LECETVVFAVDLFIILLEFAFLLGHWGRSLWNR